MMRTGLLILVLFVVYVHAKGQIQTPAKWSYKAQTSSVSLGDEIDLIFQAELKDHWYLYSTEFDCEDGPMKTAFVFTPHLSYVLQGEVEPINPEDKYDDIFECPVKIFHGKAVFRQSIKITKIPLVVAGEYEYQVCSNKTGQCIPGGDDFAFTGWQYTSTSDTSIREKVENDPDTSSSLTTAASPNYSKRSPSSLDEKKSKNNALAVDNQGPILGKITQQAERKRSLWGFFVLSFVAGLAALLTPCVFPMIPMTVSFFAGRGTKAQAVFYGLSIIFIYTVVGALLAPLMGPEMANHLSTEWVPNLIFFSVFIIFGLSFLGLFEITMPGSFITRVDKQADKGGMGGVFFMASTLVLVSFSCTGPIVGSILVSSAGGEVIKPIVGMLGFSLAFAIPFTVFAIFPGWLHSLPKSGGWLNNVKVVLGFLEIGFAFKFLSIADQAFHWRILDREVNIAIWIVLVTLIGIYLMKGFKMPGDEGEKPEKGTVSVGRISLAIIAFTFVIYLIPGMWGAPLKSLAGYLPPMYTHDFNVMIESLKAQPNTICTEPKYRDFLRIPHGIQGYFDYDEALTCARQQNKPLFIDFTGHGCTNCREMEARVWSDQRVLKLLKDDFIMLALYVDDKTELPQDEWYVSSYDNKEKRTIGKQNADLQIRRLNNNAQPFYVILGPDERVLLSPKTYDLSVQNFISFLESGKKQYQRNYP